MNVKKLHFSAAAQCKAIFSVRSNSTTGGQADLNSMASRPDERRGSGEEPIRARDFQAGGELSRVYSRSIIRDDTHTISLGQQIAQGLAKKAMDFAKKGHVTDGVLNDIKVRPLFLLFLSSSLP
jgi:hypothetical protein